MSSPRTETPAHTLSVYTAQDVSVIEGANLGDGISYYDELMLDDVYALRPGAPNRFLAMAVDGPGRYHVGPDSGIGTPGAGLHLDCILTFMSHDGQTFDALVLVETDPSGNASAIYCAPLAKMTERRPYALVGIDTAGSEERLARLSCARFTRGTRVTLSTGEQCPIETLRVGDRLLTRDDGPQEIRWIGEETVRAVGHAAPILITKGTLHNISDLLVSPDHRLFIYQRRDTLGAGRSELLVKARHLLNGKSVRVREGGFIDYFQLLFDRHQIIYAEGIAAESMHLDQRTGAALPDEVVHALSGLSADSKLGLLDVNETLLDRPDAADLLRQASRSRTGDGPV